MATTIPQNTSSLTFSGESLKRYDNIRDQVWQRLLKRIRVTVMQSGRTEITEKDVEDAAIAVLDELKNELSNKID